MLVKKLFCNRVGKFWKINRYCDSLCNFKSIQISGFDDINCGKTVKVSDYYKNITQMLMFERVFGQVYPQFEKQNSRHAKNNSKG